MKKYYQCNCCYDLVISDDDMHNLHCKKCVHGHYKLFNSKTTPAMLAAAKQRDIDYSKQFHRSGACIDNGTEPRTSLPSYNSRLSIGFRMLDGTLND
jgi:uncharacterized Fe-S cluster protein YjdI